MTYTRVPPKKLKDRQGLFAYYRDQFFPRETGNPEFDGSRVLGLLTSFQQRFNDISCRPCRGLRFMREIRKNLSPSTQRCNHPLCPSCWHIKQVRILNFLDQLYGWPHYYIRETWQIHWLQDLHQKCVNRFKSSNHGSYQLLAYTMNYDAISAEYDEREASLDPFKGEISYQVYGLFASTKRIQDYFNRGNQIHVFDASGKAVGLVDKEEHPNPSSLREAWVSRLKTPWFYNRHPRFADYIHRFDQYRPTGRSWSRVQAQFIKPRIEQV